MVPRQLPALGSMLQLPVWHAVTQAAPFPWNWLPPHSHRKLPSSTKPLPYTLCHSFSCPCSVVPRDWRYLIMACPSQLNPCVRPGLEALDTSGTLTAITVQILTLPRPKLRCQEGGSRLFATVLANMGVDPLHAPHLCQLTS